MRYLGGGVGFRIDFEDRINGSCLWIKYRMIRKEKNYRLRLSFGISKRIKDSVSFWNEEDMGMGRFVV